MVNKNTARGSCFLTTSMLLLLGALAISAHAQVTGPVIDSDTSTIRNPGAPVGDLTSYGKPNQSRIWYNSAQNRWDAVVPKLDADDNSSDHYILTDVDGRCPVRECQKFCV